MNNSIKTDLGDLQVFSRNLIRYLNNSGKTQKEVSKAIGVSTGTINDWVKCRNYPRMDKVQALAKIFGVQVSDLVDDVNLAKEIVSDTDQEFLDLFHKVPEERREFVLSLIRTTIDNL